MKANISKFKKLDLFPESRGKLPLLPTFLGPLASPSTAERGGWGSRGKFPGLDSQKGPQKVLLLQKRRFTLFCHLIQSYIDLDGGAE